MTNNERFRQIISSILNQDQSRQDQPHGPGPPTRWGQGGQARASPHPELHRHPDPYGALLASAMAHWYQQPCCFDPDTGSQRWADRDSPVLALGPSGTVKTSGIIIPAIITAYGGFFYD